MRNTFATSASIASAPSSSPVASFTVALVLFLGLSALLFLGI
ncbi:MAG: hypothetical protein V4739_07915 [Pseudomonadota bacterium]